MTTDPDTGDDILDFGDLCYIPDILISENPETQELIKHYYLRIIVERILPIVSQTIKGMCALNKEKFNPSNNEVVVKGQCVSHGEVDTIERDLKK